MQKTAPLSEIKPDASIETAATAAEQIQPATVWVSRITGIVGLICLALALLEWAFRQGHYRTVLALLTVAMFAAILHSYTFEDGS